jgi:hypothetical protein
VTRRQQLARHKGKVRNHSPEASVRRSAVGTRWGVGGPTPLSSRAHARVRAREVSATMSGVVSVVETVVELAAGVAVRGRAFTAPARTEEDAALMRRMLAHLRAVVSDLLEAAPAGGGWHVREPDASGLRHWIRVPDRAALRAARELTTVGFFGQARDGVDQRVIHELEREIVETLEQVPGVLSYYDVELTGGRYGNLILCASPEVPVQWRSHGLHRRAVELTPRYYESVRLHTGLVPGPLLGGAELILLRTRYFDYRDEPPWRAVREARTPTRPTTPRAVARPTARPRP